MLERYGYTELSVQQGGPWKSLFRRQKRTTTNQKTVFIKADVSRA